MLKIGIIISELDLTKANFSEAINCLTVMQRKALAGRLEDKTLQDVGKELGVTRERVRALEAKAFEKLIKSVFTEQIINQIKSNKYE